MNDDNALISRIINHGDHHAFATLVTKHQCAIRQFLRRLTAGDHAYADDIAQETFLRIYQKIDTFLGHASFSTWAHKIAYHCFLKSQQKVYRTYECNNVDFSSIQAPIDHAEKDIMVEQLMKVLEITERVCITLSISAGMSHQEISTITTLPLGTVKSHISRGKQKLMERINA